MPSCCIMPNSSATPQNSTTLPTPMRRMPISVIVIRLPVAGMPAKDPWCVPRTVQRAAILSPSAIYLFDGARPVGEGGADRGEPLLEPFAALPLPGPEVVTDEIGGDQVVRQGEVTLADHVLEEAPDHGFVLFR